MSESDPSALPRKRGRKPNLDQSEAVLGAAVAEFIDKGYEGANLRAILASSGASAGSLYRRFGSKEGLFRAIIENHVDLHYPRGVRLKAEGRGIEAELRDFATAYLREFLDPKALSLFRLILAEAETFPEESKRLWELGPRNAIAEVEAYLRHHQAEGVIQVDDPHLAAAQFLEMVKAGFHVRQLLTGAAPTPEELGTNVRQAVAIFCKGIYVR